MLQFLNITKILKTIGFIVTKFELFYVCYVGIIGNMHYYFSSYKIKKIKNIKRTYTICIFGYLTI